MRDFFQRFRNAFRLHRVPVAIDRHYNFFTNHHPSSFVVDQAEEPVKSRLKLIAYYLTQFHPIPENNSAWGEGFTEWSNTSRAYPLFEGHYQPRLPAALGYYDLRTPDVMEKQITMAKKYGVTGFCFYYYWFDGKRLLEQPLNRFLEDRSMQMDFCFCWANGNWTKKWDGSDREVIAEQKYGTSSYHDIIKDMIPALLDERYIRVGNKPIIIIYQVSDIPNIKELCRIWRATCADAGIPDILILASNTFDYSTPVEDGLDGIAEFPPHGLTTKSITRQKRFFAGSFAGRVYDYAAAAKLANEKEFPDYFYAKGVMVSWDNTARVGNRSRIYDGSSPEAFRNWLGASAQKTMSQHSGPAHELLFINAWNEWAEGTYLEPDQHFGYAYLSACRDVASQYPE